MSSEINFSLLLPNWSKLIGIATTHYEYLLINWWATFSVAVTAAILALIFSLILSVTSLRYRVVQHILTPIVAISQSFPLQAIAPLILIVFGIGFWTKTFIAFIIAFFPIYGTCAMALYGTPRPLLAHLKICDTSFLDGVIFVRLPAAMPTVLSSIKVGFTLSVLGAVVAEFIQPDKGLGQLILVAQSNYDIEMMYLCIMLLMLQGLLVFWALTALESRLFNTRG